MSVAGKGAEYSTGALGTQRRSAVAVIKIAGGECVRLSLERSRGQYFFLSALGNVEFPILVLALALVPRPGPPAKVRPGSIELPTHSGYSVSNALG